MASKTKEGAASAAPSPTLAEIAEQLHLRQSDALATLAKNDQWFLDHARDVGALLIQAKAQTQRGEWRPWLTKHFQGHHVTATNYMRVADPDNGASTLHCKSLDEALKSLRDPKKVAARAKDGESSKGKKAKPTAAGKRMHAAKMGRAEAKRNGRPVAFWEIGWEVSRLVYGLASWKVEDVPLDYDNLNAMTTVEEDLLYLYDWMDETISLIHSRMGEHGMRQQLRKLQARTVENGCTPEEAANAARAAGRLQRKIDNVLEAAS